VWKCWPPSVGTRDPGPGLFFFMAGFCLFASGVIFLFGVGLSVSFWRGVVVFVVVVCFGGLNPPRVSTGRGSSPKFPPLGCWNSPPSDSLLS
jgi:hypothetical protein